jgi:hypothetical protein
MISTISLEKKIYGNLLPLYSIEPLCTSSFAFREWDHDEGWWAYTPGYTKIALMQFTEPFLPFFNGPMAV